MHPETEFTATEHQLLYALCTGATNKAIARHLGKSEFTVRNQLSGLFKKISANNRTQAVGLYREHTTQQSQKSQSSGNSVSVQLRAPQDSDKMQHPALGEK